MNRLVIAVGSVVLGGGAALRALALMPQEPCAAGWVIADKTIMPSPVEQITAGGSKIEEVTGGRAMFRKKMVMTLTCSDGRYRVETSENP